MLDVKSFKKLVYQSSIALGNCEVLFVSEIGVSKPKERRIKIKGLYLLFYEAYLYKIGVDDVKFSSR